MHHHSTSRVQQPEICHPGGADWCWNMDRSDFVQQTDSLGKCWVLWGSYPWYIYIGEVLQCPIMRQEGCTLEVNRQAPVQYWWLVSEYIYIVILAGGSLWHPGWGSVQHGTVLEVD